MDKKLAGLMIVFFLSFALFTSFIVFNKPLTQITKAKEDFAPSAKNSILSAWPTTVNADGKSETTITVFARSATNKPIQNKPVKLETTLGTVKEDQLQTSKTGMAEFHLSSTNPGSATVHAIINKTVKTNQKVTITFK